MFAGASTYSTQAAPDLTPHHLFVSDHVVLARSPAAAQARIENLEFVARSGHRREIGGVEPLDLRGTGTFLVTKLCSVTRFSEALLPVMKREAESRRAGM